MLTDEEAADARGIAEEAMTRDGTRDGCDPWHKSSIPENWDITQKSIRRFLMNVIYYQLNDLVENRHKTEAREP